jgi:hypothetical protein
MPGMDCALALGVFRVALCVAWIVEVSPRLVQHFALYPRELCFPLGGWGKWVQHVLVNQEAAQRRADETELPRCSLVP